MKTETELLVIHETVMKSWLRDLGTFVWVSAIIGLGVVLDSGAMQWFGAVVAFLIMLNRARGAAKRVDVAGARKLLDEIEQGSAD